MTHTNHFHSDDLKPLNISHQAPYASRIPKLGRTSVMESSCVRLSKLAKMAPDIGSLDELRAVLAESDDANGMNNVYQEGPYWGTICTLIAFPSQMTVYRFNDVRYDRPVVHDVAALLSNPSPRVA